MNNDSHNDVRDAHPDTNRGTNNQRPAHHAKADVTTVIRQNLKRRHAAARRFRIAARAATLVATLFMIALFAVIIKNGVPGLMRTEILLEVDLSHITPVTGARAPGLSLQNANYARPLREALRALFPAVTERAERRELQRLVSDGAAWQLRDTVVADAELAGGLVDVWLPTSAAVNEYYKLGMPPGDAKISEAQATWLVMLDDSGRIKRRFNVAFFQNGDSRSPELAGIKGAFTGSLYMLMVTLILSFPLGVTAACYLEEFAPRNRYTDFLEISINNLAAVPSIVFGLLGLAVFINFLSLPRSAPLVGGLVLTLMTLPTIIIASRAALRSVPPSIREAALGIGASQMQTLFHHVLPLALPGILTGTIIGMAQALGEAAPLLMIGMVAFVVDVPSGPLDPSTVLPVQIFLWAGSPERGFVEKTASAILVLITFLILMNLLAVLIRNRFQKKW